MWLVIVACFLSPSDPDIKGLVHDPLPSMWWQRTPKFRMTNVLLGAARRTQGSESAPHAAACRPLNVWGKRGGWRPQLWHWLLFVERKMWVFKKLVAHNSLREEMFLSLRKLVEIKKNGPSRLPSENWNTCRIPSRLLHLWPDVCLLSTCEWMDPSDHCEQNGF